MKKLLCLLILHSPLLLTAQTNSLYKGIKWVENMTWEQIKDKAKMENKYIFLDCFATWCAPCKKMDVSTFRDSAVGIYYNEKFISVKVQMDKTVLDDDKTRKWYETANNIQKAYGVVAYPSFLFFSPDGEVVHKAVGGYNPLAFLRVGRDAINPESQFYTVLKKFNMGTIKLDEMKSKALSLRLSGKELAEKIALEYLKRLTRKEFSTSDNLTFASNFNENTQIQKLAINYILSLKKKDIQIPSNMKFMEFFRDDFRVKKIANKYIRELKVEQINRKEIVDYLWAFSQDLDSPGFGLFLKHSSKFDSLKQFNNYAKEFIESVIVKCEIIEPILKPSFKVTDFNPNWDSVEIVLSKKYGNQYSENSIIAAKEVWYTNRRDWPRYCEVLISKLNKNDVNNLNAFRINNACWAIFMRCNDVEILNKAIFFMNQLFERNPGAAAFFNYQDTYANLLYKIGQTEKALKLEAMAAESAPSDHVVRKNYENMKKGIPNWREN